MSLLYAYDPIEQEHTREGHPENRGRLSGTLSLLRDRNVLDAIEPLRVEPLSDARLRLVHAEEYLAQVERVCASGGGNLDPDTYAVTSTERAARMSAGALVGLTEAVMRGSARRGMCLMRPPGHHALPASAMGFCIFGNVALAAAVARHELGAQRVLIVDWDVHHGNGTEAVFYEDPSVAFFSTHQYPFYPGTGALGDIGRGAGRGFNVNVPFPPGVGDEGYAAAFDRVLDPFARRFRPDLILVSAGYDAHWRDPLANEGLSVAGYGELLLRVLGLAEDLCDGRLVLTLEGGYDLDVLPYNVLTSLRLLRDPSSACEDPFGKADRDEIAVGTLLDRIINVHGLAT